MLDYLFFTQQFCIILLVFDGIPSQSVTVGPVKSPKRGLLSTRDLRFRVPRRLVFALWLVECTLPLADTSTAYPRQTLKRKQNGSVTHVSSSCLCNKKNYSITVHLRLKISNAPIIYVLPRLKKPETEIMM